MRAMKLLAGLALVAGMVGCHGPIVGTWKADSSSGELPIASVSFCEDGTYTAEANYNGNTRAMSGHYAVDAGQLSLETEGDKRVYGVAFADGNDTMTVTHGEKSGKMVRMKGR